MKWLAIRVGFAFAFWMLCSGSLSSEAWSKKNANTVHHVMSSEAVLDIRGEEGDSEQSSNVFLLSYQNSSVMVIPEHSTLAAREESFSMSDRSNEWALTHDDGIFSSEYVLLHVRGGQQDQLDLAQDVNDTVTTNFADDDNGVAAEKDVKRDTALIVDTAADEQNSSWPSVSSSFKHKVASRINRWKRKDRTIFLDRMALVSDALINSEHDAILEKEDEDIQDEAIVTHQSDLRREGRFFTIVTTAALPWMTGTAVNPLLRAAHLVRKTQEINNSTKQQWVTLVVPWLELEEDRQELYGRIFADEQEQENFIRSWLRQDADMPDAADPKTGLKIR